MKNISSNKSWLEWLLAGLEAGRDPLRLAIMAHDAHFSTESIRRVMGQQYPAGHSDLAVDYTALANIPITQPQANAHRVDTDKLQLYVVEDVLTIAECNALMVLINSRLSDSTLAHENPDKRFRTSQTCDLHQLKSVLVQQIDERIANIMGVNSSFSESMQAQKYRMGEEYKPHYDFFMPKIKEHQRFLGKPGNRSWTCMIYLNKPEMGGYTTFQQCEISIQPKPGRAVIWNNINPDGRHNEDSMHHGTMVKRGEKYIITKWFRQRDKNGLPFRA